MRSTHDRGDFDLLEGATTGMEVVSEIVARIASFSSELKERMEKRVNEIESLNSASGGAPPSAYRRTTNRLAEDLNHYSSRARGEIESLAKYLDEVLVATG